MTKMIASALALTIAASGAWADNHSASNMSEEDGASDTEMVADASKGDTTSVTDGGSMMDSSEMLIRARDITGGNVYTLNEANDEGWSADSIYTEVGADWNDIGEIEDLVMNENGQLIGIVAEVGGFLDIADKHVVLPVENISLVAVDDATYSFVTAYNEEDLEEMDAVDEGFWN